MEPDGAVLGALRRKVSAQLESHEYESAVFLADKLVSMSNGAEDVSAHRLRVPLGSLRLVWCRAVTACCIAAPSQDVYTLAQAYFRAGMHQRAIYAIVQAGLVERHKFRCGGRSYHLSLCCTEAALHRQSMPYATACSQLLGGEMPRGQRELGRGTASARGVAGTTTDSSLLKLVRQVLPRAHRRACVAQADAGAGEVGDKDYRSSMSLLRGTVLFTLSRVAAACRPSWSDSRALHPVGVRCDGRPRASHRGEREFSLTAAAYNPATYLTRRLTRIGRRTARRCTRIAVVMKLLSILRSITFSRATRSRHCSPRCASLHSSS